MRLTPARLAALATAATVALIAGWAIHVLSQPNIRRSGTNHVDIAHFVATANPGQAVCQTELVPKDTGAAMLLVTDFVKHPTPTVRAFVRSAGGRVLASGVLPQGRWAEGNNYIRLTPAIRATTRHAQFCLADRGRVPITIGGENVVPSAGATVDGRLVDGRMGIMWYRPGQESYLDVAGLVLSRVRYGKASWFGPWLPVALVLLIAACLGGAVYLAVRPCPS